MEASSIIGVTQTWSAASGEYLSVSLGHRPSWHLSLQSFRTGDLGVSCVPKSIGGPDFSSQTIIVYSLPLSWKNKFS